MRRKLSLLIALVGVLGLIGLSPAAQADHGGTKPPTTEPHEGPPVPPTPDSVADRAENACVVSGQVAIGNSSPDGGGIGTPVNHNHYRFEGVQIACLGTNPDYTGSFGVDAAGGTDGFDPLLGSSSADHGEDTSRGWSHGSCYLDAPGCASSTKANVNNLYPGTNDNPITKDTQNLGEIRAANNLDPAAFTVSTDSWIKFCRGDYDFDGDLTPDCLPSVTGGNVIAWGALADWDHTGEDLCFYADLGLEPIGVNINPIPAKINQAVLEGDALTWEADKDTCAGPAKFRK